MFSGESSRLGQVTISSGGRIVFDPNHQGKNKLTARGILIDDGGKLEIGGENKKCWFREEAEILLTG